VLTSHKKYFSLAAGVIAALIYGGLTRLAFAQNSEIFGTLSISFIVLVPPVLGFLTVILATDTQKASWKYIVVMPWVSCGVCMVLAAVFLLEFWFCIALAIPLFLVLSSLGGAVAALVWRLAQRRKSKDIISGALLLFTIMPYLFAPFERLLPLQPETRTVHSQIEIDAPPAVIWQNITDLRRIEAPEQRESLFHLAGLPRPLEAKMACQQVGCIRRGMWENGLAFEGSITRIVPGHSFWLDLRADTLDVQPSSAPLSQIGGSVFSMVDDGYEISDAGGRRSVLQLYSTYRLNTRINAYGAFWLDLMLRDIQGYILSVEKSRSES
jgi:hypothetical protein